MSGHAHLFKGGEVNRRKVLGFLLLGLCLFSGPSSAEGASKYSKRESSLYRDMFDQLVFYEGTTPLHLERLYRELFGGEKRALNVNRFDEVPESTFFENRHGREKMSLEQLKDGPQVTPGPESGSPWQITRGKFEGMTPGFFVRDRNGDRYLLKFDELDSLELTTGAEVVTSRLMHAIGYHVPQYTLVTFKKEQLEVAPNATIYDDTGFRKKLTAERLEEFLLFIPTSEEGLYRASASRIVEGKILGPMRFQGRRRNDPDDPVNHEDRREIRALRVFSAWVSNSDMREGNTLDVVQEREGQTKIWHYLIDFGSTLGSRASGPKAPMMGHVYTVDYGDIFKSILSFGFWKKPWEKRWDEAGREIKNPAVGYFDNRHFNPGGYKTQLPYYAFKDITRADGFWAAKVLMRFTDEEIAAAVSTGRYSDKEAELEIVRVLSERRDLIGRYWFGQANPLDDLRLFQANDGGLELQFEDLAVRHGFETGEGNVYRFNVIANKGGGSKLLAQKETAEPLFQIDSDWFDRSPQIDLLIRTKRATKEAWSPFVRVELQKEGDISRLSGISHQD